MIDGTKNNPIERNYPIPKSNETNKSEEIPLKILNETHDHSAKELSERSFKVEFHDFKKFIKGFDLNRLKDLMEPDIFLCWECILKKSTPIEDVKKIFGADPEGVEFKIYLDKDVYLTPVIASILNQRIDQLGILLDHVPDIDAAYFGGHTLAHFAAITGNLEIISLLKERGANFELPNILGTTASHYLEINSKVVKPEQLQAIHPFKDSTAIDQNSYVEHFHSKYLAKKTVYDPLELLALAFEAHEWYEHYDVEDPIQRCLEEQLSKFLQTNEENTSIYVTPLVAKDDKTPIPEALKGQWEARARNSFKAGELIGEYTGRITHSFLTPRAELAGHDRVIGFEELTVDAIEEGNLLSLINDGPPNCAPEFVLDEKGISHVVIYTLKDIEEGEVLHFNYGRGFFENLGIKRELLSPAAIEKVYNETDEFKKMVTELIRARFPKERSLEDLLEIRYFQKMYDYLKSMIDQEDHVLNRDIALAFKKAQEVYE